MQIVFRFKSYQIVRNWKIINSFSMETACAYAFAFQSSKHPTLIIVEKTF